MADRSVFEPARGIMRSLNVIRVGDAAVVEQRGRTMWVAGLKVKGAETGGQCVQELSVLFQSCIDCTF